MYHIKNPADLDARKAAGKAIIRLSETVFKTGVGGTETEWQVFDRDPAAWLYRYGYRLDAPGVAVNGAISPNLVRLVPVYDTPHMMHLRVPCRENIDPTLIPPSGDEYAADFDAFLASYFARQCR